MASFTSGRTGSIIPARPMKQSCCSRLSGFTSSGRPPGQKRSAAASTRSALSAMAWFSARISARFSSVMGRICPSSTKAVQRRSTSSGAPFVYWTKPLSVRWMVDIILREESNGASATRGCSVSRRRLSHPCCAAKFTSAASVGSPCAPPSVSAASLQSAIAAASSAVSPVCSTTVILFCVNVPVLSEQITCVQPSVSTAVRRRMTAWRRLMFVTPIESTTVTTVASPSGIAATASDTATMNVSSTPRSVKSPITKRSKAKMNTQMPSTIHDKVFPSWVSFFCRGVCSCSV